jgi:hypothetical protein
MRKEKRIIKANDQKHDFEYYLALAAKRIEDEIRNNIIINNG